MTADNYNWKFNKTDKDPWPSRLHGHEYDKGLKLDATNGHIYDAATRRYRTKLKSKFLDQVHDELRHSKDFNALMAEGVDKMGELHRRRAGSPG